MGYYQWLCLVPLWEYCSCSCASNQNTNSSLRSRSREVNLFLFIYIALLIESCTQQNGVTVVISNTIHIRCAANNNIVQYIQRTPYLQYSIVQYSTVQYSTVQYSTVQYSTVQYSGVLRRAKYTDCKSSTKRSTGVRVYEDDRFDWSYEVRQILFGRSSCLPFSFPPFLRSCLASCMPVCLPAYMFVFVISSTNTWCTYVSSQRKKKMMMTKNSS